MTVASTQSYIEYAGDGSTKAFAIPFKFLLNSDISALISDADGNITTPINGYDFSVTGAGGEGGTATFNNAYASGYSLLLYRDPPATQETKYYENGKFPATSHEAALDKLTMLIQERGWKFDSLALKRPSVFASYYDAQQNRIANVAAPKDAGDAVNKTYADAIGSGSNSYTDQQLLKEAQIREAADNLERDARAEADANFQRQLSGEVPLEASAFSVISWHDQTVDNSIEIPANKNAWSFGKQLGISPGQVVTVGDNSSWTIADGRQVEDEDLHNLIADTITTTNGAKTLNVSNIATESEVTDLQAQVTALGTRMTAEEGKVNDIAHGGTGAKTASAARTALGAKADTGVTDATNAAAGATGEYLSATTSSTSLTTGVISNATSLTLTAGDWDVSGVVQFDNSAAMTTIQAGTSVNTAASQGFPYNSALVSAISAGTQRLVIPLRRVNVSTNTTIYAIALAGFTSGTCTVNGFLSARRIR